jgi:hypothetical protein
VRALPSQHFAFAITALMFLPVPPIAAVLPPYIIAAAYVVSNYGAAHFSGTPLWRAYGARAHAFLSGNRQQALLLSAQMEVSLGAYLVFLAFTPRRALLVTYFFWQQLRQRYWAPDSGAYHRAVWGSLGAATAPLRARFPLLEKGAAAGARWFQAGQAMAGGAARR